MGKNKKFINKFFIFSIFNHPLTNVRYIDG